MSFHVNDTDFSRQPVQGLCWSYLSISGLAPTGVSPDTILGPQLELLCATERGTVLDFLHPITCQQCQGRVQFTILGTGLIHSQTYTHTLENPTQGGHIYPVI